MHKSSVIEDDRGPYATNLEVCPMNAILLGYDGTEESKRALERAIELTKAFQAKLLVTSVAPTAQAAAGRSMGPLDPTDPPAQHQAELEEAGAVIKAAGLSAELLPAIGHPAETIVQIAHDNRRRHDRCRHARTGVRPALARAEHQPGSCPPCPLRCTNRPLAAAALSASRRGAD